MTRAQAAALESVLDPRVGRSPDELDPALRASLDELGLLAPERRAEAGEALAAAIRARRFTWGANEVTHGRLLEAFARHCAEDLDDVEVEESAPTLLVARWRRETSLVELRAGVAGVARLASASPTLIVTELGDEEGAVVEEFLADAELRSRVLVFDPDRLEKIGAVRSSLFVYLEWFLRDTYGVKVLPAPAFTRGLIDRGIIHLGMG